MVFHDVIHGHIDFGDGPESRLVRELIACPEVHRLRHLRLLNFDVPVLQELATSHRFAHAVGTCYSASVLCSRSPLPAERRRVIIASALLHDIGILPYGHLVETALRRRTPSFSHEALFRKIVHGTYHLTNLYHQILPGESLLVPSVLRRHGLNVEDLISVVHPGPGESSAISADIDIDNIDNIHRMAALIGMGEARTNSHCLLRQASLDHRGELVFHEAAMEAIAVWGHLRSTLYSLMIGHPDCVAYSAYVHDLVQLAVDHRMITATDWYIRDVELQERLRHDGRTSELAEQMVQGCRYSLVDYVWAHGQDSLRWAELAQELPQRLPEPPIPRTKYFVWPERGLISRAVTVQVAGMGQLQVGTSTASLLVALVNPGTGPKSAADDFVRRGREVWRDDVIAVIAELAPGLEFNPSFPEDFTSGRGQPSDQAVQYELF